MYHNILTQKEHPKYRAVKKTVKLILEFVEADCIYFSKSEAESKIGILTVVVSKKSPHHYDEVFDHLWKVIQNHNSFIFCLFNKECIKDEVKRGNLFFIFHCKETELVYKDAGQKTVLDIKKINMKRFLKQTAKRYRMWTSEANTVARDLKYHRRCDNHLMALYVLQQQFRYLFINASWLLTGEWMPHENVSYQQEHITVFNNVLGKTFDSTKEKEREVLKKIELARKAVQCGEEAEPFDAETVDFASDRLEWMKNEVRTLFQQHTEKIKQIFKDYETNDIAKLKNIERICTMCLKTLRHDKKKNEIFIAEIRVYNYIELGMVIRNLLKLCIVAMDQDAAEVPETVKNQSIDVALILGITLQLFPIDEFELLNEINNLFPVNCADEEKKNDSSQK